ncbi:hypothetical protein [Aromatoleum aromaticum]|uniref:hypothetical protein n=1 Tax=Aromatoleum aromaticum TaxID=551760 RepID=UPI0012FF0168|nr:hypothetical protein [Aromatoleum aromaticum]
MSTIRGFSSSQSESILQGLLIEARQKADERPLWAAFASILEDDLETADALLDQFRPKPEQTSTLSSNVFPLRRR